MILAGLSLPVVAQEIRLRIGDVTSPLLALRGVEAVLALSGRQPLTVRVAAISLHDRVWRNVSLRCSETRIASQLIECRRGQIGLDAAIPLTFSYRTDTRELHLVLLPAATERWEVRVRSRGQQTVTEVHVENGALARLNPFLGDMAPRLSAGSLTLDATWTTDARGRRALELQGRVAGAAFSDPSGLRAGEKVGGDFALRARFDRAWAWELSAAWTAGEVFWQPFYLAPARRTLAASGSADARALVVHDGQLSLQHVGTVRFNGAWDRMQQRLDRLVAEGPSLSLAGVYDTFLKPLWRERLLGQLAVAGEASGRIEMRGGKLAVVDLEARNAAVRHENGLFELNGLAARTPWRRDVATSARLSVGNGQLWGVPLGAFALDAELRPDSIRVAPIAVPVLDGVLKVDGLTLSRNDADWRWEARAALQPVSMDRLSSALKWPRMHGTLSGEIPRVSYERQTLAVDGALLFRVFDGSVVVKDLRVADLLSRASRAYGSVEMRGLDLDLLTRTFSFGSMQGRIDVSLRNLELANWRPVRFDAKVESSPGDYPRKISQRAVDNIAALGGASASAVLQRSFLRFFEQFRYDRIGLACRLERNVCAMAGIEDVNDGYLIVKGGGIPAISVIGYNRLVGWNELLERLARIRQGGMKPVVQ